MAVISRKHSEVDDTDELVGGQPRWYWGLSRDGKVAELERRAEAAGAKYVRDGSRDGLKADGTPPEKERLRAAYKARITKRDLKKIAKREKALQKETKHDHD